MNKIRKVVIWVLIGLVLILFWISLRDDELALEYGLAALVVWGITYGIQYLWKKEE